ncbi:hypothetical protein BS78_07G025300 [Paspalum vaginatum]|nr:hypothetical protein BS78_07G025300 [Paspalum vaginatum]
MNSLLDPEIRTCDAHGDEAGIPIVRFEDLPMDVIYTIMSKLPPKEFARARVLSTKWRCMRSLCPRLTFNGVEVCKCDRKHRGMVFETLEVKIDLADDLVDHLNSWVDFSISTRTKNLTLDLKPRISCLQHMQLSFVSLKPPLHYTGFPNLRRLHLQLVHASKKDIGHVLSHCCNLEWLCIDRCDLGGELVVNGLLSHLLYLRIECCKFTKVEFHAVNLATFEYDGPIVPIVLRHSLKLNSATIVVYKAVCQHALISLLNGLPNVQNRTLRIGWLLIEKQWLWDNPMKFSCLKHLQLYMFLYEKDIENILYSVSFLRATPFIEILEVRFTGSNPLWLAKKGPRRQGIGQCEYSYLKNIWIAGFKAARGQPEFVLHVVENTPALEAIIVDTQQVVTEHWTGSSGPPYEEAKRIAIDLLSATVPQTVELVVF